MALVSVRRLPVSTENCGAVSNCTSVVSLARLSMMCSKVNMLRIVGCLSNVDCFIISAARFVCLSVLVNRDTTFPEWNSIVMRG